jgi:hypothetical protein
MGADGTSGITKVQTINSLTNVASDDSGKAFLATANLTIVIPLTVTDGWSIYVDADGGDVTLSTSATINGLSSLVVTQGNSAFVYSTGTAHYARFFVSSAITSIAASGVGFTAITGNAATTVQAAIAVLTGLWNNVSTLGRTLISHAAASDMRTSLGLGTAATLAVGTGANNIVQLNGSGNLPAVNGAALTGIIGPAPAAVMEDRKSSGTDGQAIAAAWTKRDLATIVNNTGAYLALASSQFTPTQAGWVEWQAPGRDQFQSRLYNVTDSAVIRNGTSAVTTGGSIGLSNGGGPVSAGKAYRIEQYDGGPGGLAADTGAEEIYTRVKYWPM